MVLEKATEDTLRNKDVLKSVREEGAMWRNIVLKKKELNRSHHKKQQLFAQLI